VKGRIPPPSAAFATPAGSRLNAPTAAIVASSSRRVDHSDVADMIFSVTKGRVLATQSNLAVRAKPMAGQREREWSLTGRHSSAIRSDDSSASAVFWARGSALGGFIPFTSRAFIPHCGGENTVCCGCGVSKRLPQLAPKCGILLLGPGPRNFKSLRSPAKGGVRLPAGRRLALSRWQGSDKGL
jgi:hypothetical protein